MLELLEGAGERVDDAGCESGSVLFDEVEEIVPGVSVVKIEGQFVLLCERKVPREDG